MVKGRAVVGKLDGKLLLGLGKKAVYSSLYTL